MGGTNLMLMTMMRVVQWATEVDWLLEAVKAYYEIDSGFGGVVSSLVILTGFTKLVGFGQIYLWFSQWLLNHEKE
jgi:hypothetical protein